MNIERLVVGQLQTNCYLVSCPKTGEAVIIDPGDDGDFISRKILDLKLKPKLILATHGHFDHVLAVVELKLAFKIPFLMHKDDLILLKRTKRTAEHFLISEAERGKKKRSDVSFEGWPELVGKPPKVDRYLREGDAIAFGREKLKVLETPGHTPGGTSLCSGHLRGGGVLFSGDTLFCQGVGRTDFSYCSYEDLIRSLKKLFKLPSKTAVYPGHGSETNLLAERSFFQRWA